MLTKVLVIVVPILAPITIGIAIEIGKPPATRPTITDVTVLEDCTNAVTRIPNNKATNGLVAKANICSAPALPPENILKPPLTVDTATNTKYTNAATLTQLNIFFIMLGFNSIASLFFISKYHFICIK